jgi:hypothetical protein
MSASIHAPAIVIATPVFALPSNNNTNIKTTKVISGYWVGIMDLPSIQGSIKNLNLTNNERIVVVDHNERLCSRRVLYILQDNTCEYIGISSQKQKERLRRLI